MDYYDDYSICHFTRKIHPNKYQKNSLIINIIMYQYFIWFNVQVEISHPMPAAVIYVMKINFRLNASVSATGWAVQQIVCCFYLIKKNKSE